MTVRELIVKLQTLPPDEQIVVGSDEPCFDGFDDPKIKAVFIEEVNKDLFKNSMNFAKYRLVGIGGKEASAITS